MTVSSTRPDHKTRLVTTGIGKKVASQRQANIKSQGEEVRRKMVQVHHRKGRRGAQGRKGM
jgi:hypothetical protein